MPALDVAQRGWVKIFFLDSSGVSRIIASAGRRIGARLIRKDGESADTVASDLCSNSGDSSPWVGAPLLLTLDDAFGLINQWLSLESQKGGSYL